MLLKLREEKLPANYSYGVVQWPIAPPFFLNPRGWLIHRVRSARTYRNSDGTPRHDIAGDWCGNSGRGNHFIEVPPKDRLLCSFCEAKAVVAGELSADELAGRHVHIGTMKPIRSCCKDGRN